MKNIITFVFLISAMCISAFAQNSLPELEIAKEIKLLKSTKSDVKAIMSEFDSDEEDAEDEEDESIYQQFNSDKATVKVYHSSGKCSAEDELAEIPEWNVPKSTATKIVITFDDTTMLKYLGLNLSSFKKKLQYEDSTDDEDSISAKDFIYYDENAGIIIVTDDEEVEKIILHPLKKQIGYLCSNENNQEVVSGEMSFVDSVVNGRFVCYLRNMPSKVTNLDLKTNGVFGCKDEKCLDAKKEINVNTTGEDAENDQLVYNYTITAGKIVGSGANVIWDLAGVEPGIHSITAGTDDGCGICGETKTQVILVKENSYELILPPKIKEIILDKTELIAACPVGRLQKVRCPSGDCGISVTSLAIKGKNLTYEYGISDGEIIGSGDKVVWDLSNLKPGEYQIKVSASEDGTSFGEPKTATVVIKENPSCSIPKKSSDEK